MTPARVVLAAGTNLYALAAQHYGDATQWDRIARANGLTDPFLSGVVSLVIPAISRAGGSDGILGL